MKRLFLLRHAKARTGFNDHARSLAARGNRDSLWLGQYIEKAHFLPDLVLCSSAARTKETLVQLQTGAATLFTTCFRNDFYLASAPHMIHRLQTLEPEITAPMIIGHNPGLSQIFQQLTYNPPQDSRSLKYPTCTIAIIDFDIENWSELKSNTGRLFKLLIPSDRTGE